MKYKLDKILNLFVLIVGLLIITCWFTNQELLKIFNANVIIMVFNTALCFTITSINLLINTDIRRHKTIHFILAFIVISFASVILFQDIFSLRAGIDQLFVKVNIFDYNPHPGRTSPPTVICLILCNLVIILLNLNRKKWLNILIQVVIIGLFSIAIIGLVGSTIRFELLYRWYNYGRMAVASAIGFILLSISLWMRWYRHEVQEGNYLAREDKRIAVTGIIIIITVALSAGLSGFGILANQMEHTLEAGLKETHNTHTELMKNEIESGIEGSIPITTRLLLNQNLMILNRLPDQIISKMIIEDDVRSLMGPNINAAAIYSEAGQLIVKIGEFTKNADLVAPLNLPDKNKNVDLIWKGGAILKVTMDIAPKGKKIGTAIVERKLPYITDLTLTKSALGDTAETRVCSAVSETAMDCLPSIMHPQVFIAYPRIRGDNISSMHFGLQGKSGIRVSKDYRDKQVISAYGPVGEYNLASSVKIDTSEFYGPVREKLQFAFFILAGLCIGGILVQRIQLIPLVKRLIESEENVKNINRFQQTLLDSANFSIIACDSKGIITVFNKSAERMLGYNAEEVIGKLSPAVFHDPELIMKRAAELTTELGREVKPGIDTFIAKAMLTGSDEREWTYKRKDGTIYPVLLSVSCLRNARGKITGSLGIGMDITERKRLEKLKNEFVSTVSHELRTPLTSIRGSLGLIIAGVAGELPVKAKHLTDIAYKNCERLILLINDILDIEKVESGQMHFDMEILNLKLLLEQSVELNKPYADKFNVTFFVAPDIHDVKVNVDSARLIQIMSNLLSNAVKFSLSGSMVEIFTILKEDYVGICITDHGSGIPEEFQARIFGKFAQADSSDMKVKGGTGLGLNIAKSMIERMGGKITFTSKLNKGTTFTIDLPRVRSQPIIEQIAEGQSKILICEDDTNIAHILKHTLELNGFVVDVAFTFKQASSLIKSNNYIGMTLDLILPDKDGIEFINELRGRKSTEKLPIIVISAKAEEGREALNGSAIGIIDWLVKPIDNARLIAAIKQMSRGNKPVVLHVEDDDDIAHVVSVSLQDIAHIIRASTLADASKLLTAEKIDLILLDIELPDGSGLKLLETLNEPNHKPIPVIIFSASEVSSETSRNVASALVKSKTSVEEIVTTIISLINLDKTKIFKKP